MKFEKDLIKTYEKVHLKLTEEGGGEGEEELATQVVDFSAQLGFRWI